MDYRFTEEDEAWRQEAEEYFEKELPPRWAEESLSWPGGYGIIPLFEEKYIGECRRLWRKLGEKGWLSMGWPNWPGRRFTNVQRAIYGDIMSYNRAVAFNIATGIGAGTIMMFGSEEMKAEWLPKIASGEVCFWLAYSEPNAGSDLAALQTSAVEDGDYLVINGSKIWSSGAHVSDCAWMVVRSDPRATSKYQGVTLLIVPNDLPGITIRPLENICGIHSFNEVFFDNVRVPKRFVVGQINQGWYYLMVALGFERIGVPAGGYRRTFEEILEYVKETERNGVPMAKDPLIRSKLADIATKIEVVNQFYWQIAWQGDRGRDAGTDASIAKLVSTELSRDLAFTAMEILGPYGELSPDSKWAPLRGRVSLGYLDCISAIVGAGTNEIQRNIIAQRGLGMPRQK